MCISHHRVGVPTLFAGEDLEEKRDVPLSARLLLLVRWIRRREFGGVAEELGVFGEMRRKKGFLTVDLTRVLRVGPHP